MTSVEQIKEAISAFEAVEWCSCGSPVYDVNDPNYCPCGWVKFRLQKIELGWRTLEFLAWACSDMREAGERIQFFPTASPPHLNEQGKCLSFVIEVYPKDGDDAVRFAKVAEFIDWCRTEHWEDRNA